MSSMISENTDDYKPQSIYSYQPFEDPVMLMLIAVILIAIFIFCCIACLVISNPDRGTLVSIESQCSVSDAEIRRYIRRRNHTMAILSNIDETPGDSEDRNSLPTYQSVLNGQHDELPPTYEDALFVQNPIKQTTIDPL